MQKTEIPGIYKTRDGILINKDTDALKAYKKKKEQVRKMKNLEEDIDSLKNDMAEIKELLKGLVK